MSTTIKLREPIQFGSQVIEELTLRKPKAKDFRRMPTEPNLGDILDLVGSLSGQPKAVVDELGMDDMREVTTLVGGFMTGGPVTGSTP